MILTIRQYMEALLNSEGRFRTLEKVYPVSDSEGAPMFTVPGNGLADFRVFANGERLTLRCPLRNSAADEIRLRALAGKDRGLGSGFLAEWRLLEKEIVLFDSSGRAVETDILCRPATEGVPVADFLHSAASMGNIALILKAMASFARLTEWAENVGREGIAASKLYFTAVGEARLTGFSARSEAAGIALALFAAAAMPCRFDETGRSLLTHSPDPGPLAARLCAAAARLGVFQPEEILAGDTGEPLAYLAAYTPEEIASFGRKLSESLAVPTWTALSDSSRDPGYEWTADEDYRINCVGDGAGWKYADRFDRPAGEKVWLSVAPFREGRAEVETGEGRGLIDRGGRRILEPVYEEVVWDEYWGLVAVMLEGRWSLLDRDGVLLTETSYDWLGECSEGLILAQKDGKCGFLDTGGREAVPFVFDDATSFCEGSSLVTLGGESFLIDASGARYGRIPDEAAV